MPRRPTLRQFGDLREMDFKKSPVWINVHTEDYDEPWYDDTDEETFRPYADRPVSASDGMLLVAADATLADGSVLPGFFTPSFEDSLGQTQPHLLVSGSPQGFWAGMMGWSDDSKAAVLDRLGKSTAELFPITFTPRAGLLEVESEIVVGDFAAMPPRPVPQQTLQPVPGAPRGRLGRCLRKRS